MSTGTEEGAKRSRREAVWEVCDQLSIQGIKPSLRNVKLHHSRGSDTDVQKDVNAWYEHVFTQHARRRVVPTLPDVVVKAMETVWECASTEAAAGFASDRAAHETQRNEINEKAARLQEDLNQARVAARALEETSADLRMELAHRSERLEEAMNDIAGLRRDLDDLRRHSQKREADLLDELARVRDAHERNLKAQREDFELQAHLLREGVERQAADHRSAMGRAEEHYRDLERRSLQEVDVVRTKLKESEQLLEKQRNLTHEKDLALTSVRTELRVLSENHHTRLSESAQRCAELAADLEDAKQEIAGLLSAREANPERPKETARRARKLGGGAR